MKKFKIADFFISVVMISAFTIYWLIKKDNSFLVAYFTVGGWQVISMVVHVCNKCFINKGGSRNIYHWIALISVVTMPLGSIWILLYTAPLMAVYYAFLCYHEVYVKMQRPLAMLK